MLFNKAKKEEFEKALIYHRTLMKNAPAHIKVVQINYFNTKIKFEVTNSELSVFLERLFKDLTNGKSKDKNFDTLIRLHSIFVGGKSFTADEIINSVIISYRG